MRKNATGAHSRCTDLEATGIIRRIAGKFPDNQIAATLNRLGFRTGSGNTWTGGRIRSVRSYHTLPAWDAKIASRQTLTLEQASEQLGVSHKVVRRLIGSKKIPATQVVPWAPWEICVDSIKQEEVLRSGEHQAAATQQAHCDRCGTSYVCGTLSGFRTLKEKQLPSTRNS
jgi:hypothetical protein